MEEQRANSNGIEIVYETIGDPADPPLLLVMGLGMQLIHWDIELCEQLAERGFQVIRFDNRDSGHSTHVNAPVPPIGRAMAGLRIDPPYLLSDMAADAFGLLDELGHERAHVVGVSMGGMIAQSMAIARPERVASLTSIMSTTGQRRVSFPRPRAWKVLLGRAPRDREAFIQQSVNVFRLIGSPGFPTDVERLRAVAAVAFERDRDPAGTPRQLAAILASGDRTPALRQLYVPTVVMHGRSDPLVPFRGGVATARAVPGAELIAIPGMGHDLPREIWPRLIDAVSGLRERVTSQVA
jgi:pimeloyl-ACP methyl ester carboxylesterase